MKERIYYYPSFYYAFALPGFGLLITAIVFFFYPNGFIVSLPLLFVAGILIVAMYGTEIDYKNKRSCNYYDLIFFKIRSWHDISKYEYVSIRFEKESSSYYSRYSRQRVKNTDVISFEVHLYAFTTSKFFLCEFGSHAEARAVVDKLASKLNLKIDDQIGDQILFHKKYPGRRRR